MDKTLRIFRADRKGNTTMAETFAKDGLLSKQINGGDPFFYKNYGWVKAIKNHIDKSTDKESVFLYETTAFLSFSENEKLAREIYLKGKDKKKVTQSSINDAEAYIFSASFNFEELQKIYNGVYLFDYSCNYDKFRKIITPLLNHSIGCNICSRTYKYTHKLLIINATTFLSQIAKNDNKFDVALENATRDSEWLLMPLDPMTNGIGYQSRIPPADFWNVELYKFLTTTI